MNTLIGILKTPNSTLQQIFYNENKHMMTSAVILVLASVFSIGIATESYSEDSESINQFGMLLNKDLGMLVVENIFGVLASFVFIVIIFIIGRQLKGNSNIRKIFCLITHASLPLMIGGIVTTILFFVISFAFQDIPISDYGQFQYVGVVIQFGIYFPFAIWSLIITIKAIKIVNNFKTTKSIGVFILAYIITYIVLIPVNVL